MKKTFIYVVTVWSALNETPSTLGKIFVSSTYKGTGRKPCLLIKHHSAMKRFSQESLISFMSCGLFDEYRDEPVHVHLTKEEKEYIDALKKKQL